MRCGQLGSRVLDTQPRHHAGQRGWEWPAEVRVAAGPRVAPGVLHPDNLLPGGLEAAFPLAMTYDAACHQQMPQYSPHPILAF